MATLLSVNVGMPKDVSWRGRTVHTGVWKSPVTGPRMVRRLNIDGDGQGDLAGHGGEQRAVLVYQIDSYRHWQEFFGRDDLEHGAFGENFTVDGLGDDEVCIGDRYRIGEAEFEVTQPRVTCFRVGMRMGEPQLPSLLVAHHRPGLLHACPDRGPRHRRATRSSARRVARTPLTVADVDALLYLPGPRPGPAGGRPGHPGAQPGLARVVPEHARERRGRGSAGRRRGRAAAGLGGFPHPHGHRRGRRERRGDVVPARRGRRAAGVPARAVPDPPACRAPATRCRCAPTRCRATRPAARYRISVKRESHGLVSSYLHAHLQPRRPGSRSRHRGAASCSTTGAEPVLLISAGIGLTPVLAMLHRLASERSDTRRCGGSTPRTTRTAMPSPPRSPTCSVDLPSAHSLVYYTTPAQPPAPDSGIRAGRLTAEVIADLGLPTDANAYVCGPEPFMDDIDGRARRRRPRPGPHPHRAVRLAVSRSTPASSRRTPPRRTSRPARPGTGPAVTFARSGLTAAWSDGYVSVLELAEACDVPTQWSCRTGVCHTCVTAVLSGQASYDTPPLEPPGDDELLICSAQPTDGPRARPLNVS